MVERSTSLLKIRSLLWGEYAGKGNHTPNCFKAINTGVYKRLTKLTTINEKNWNKPLDEIYPKHFKALKKSRLVTTEPPPISQLQDLYDKEANDVTTNKEKKKKERDRKRAIYFKIGYTDYWKKPIHVHLKELRDLFPQLKWMRISMSYHRFVNLRELFQGDLNSKLLEHVRSMDFEKLPCNCRNKENCAYGGDCRTSVVVYKATCVKTNKVYIGNTQQKVKKRMQQHVQDVRKLVLKSQRLDSFASHFSKLIPPATPPNEIRLHVKFKVELLWRGNPLSVVKTFGTRECKLCAKERYEILKQMLRDPNSIINVNNEIYGACRHKPAFHRFCQPTQTASTDEATAERVMINQPTKIQEPPVYPPPSREEFSDRRENTLLPETFGMHRVDMDRECALAQFDVCSTAPIPEIDDQDLEQPQERENLQLDEQDLYWEEEI
jgi:hypothetical protein